MVKCNAFLLADTTGSSRANVTLPLKASVEALSRDEIARLLNATTCLKHQAVLSVVYDAGDFNGTPIIPRRSVTSVVVGPSDKPRILRRFLGGGGETSVGRAISNRYHSRCRGDVR